jgi:RNA polymerase sigma-70 factor (ECF subfamily)
MASAKVYTQLVQDYYVALYRFAYRLSGSENDAYDLVQETYRAAFESIHQLQKLESARSWLFTILVNVYRQQWRRKGLLQYCPPEMLHDQAGGELESSDEVDESDADLEAIDPRLLQEAIDSLPEEFRTPLLLHYLEGFKYREIAELLGVPIGTVMSRINRAKEYMRRFFRAKGTKGLSVPLGAGDVRHAM